MFPYRRNKDAYSNQSCLTIDDMHFTSEPISSQMMNCIDSGMIY
jgi:hypothetical protein